jgi:5-methylcytosine-specific restriction protein B
MERTVQFEWVDFYEEFARLLLGYKNRRDELIEKIEGIFTDPEISKPTLEKDNELVDIDPFTIFGLFNKNTLSTKNRVKIINAVAKRFDVKAAVPESFNGIPVLNALNAWFYAPVDERGERDIDNLWGLFEEALKYVDNPSAENREKVSKYFDLTINKKGNAKSKVTMGLYWIAPEVFLNLDGRNTWYIYESGRVPADVVSLLPAAQAKIKAEKYFEIAEKVRGFLESDRSNFKNFKELSYEARRYSGEVDEQKKVAKQMISKSAIIKWFAPLIQALKDLGGTATPEQARSKIIENEKLSDEEISETRGKTNVNKFENEIAFTRAHLASSGYIDRSVHGIWKLTEKGWSAKMTDILATRIYKQGINPRGGVKGSGLGDDDVATVHYWLYSPGSDAVKWDEFYDNGIMGIGWGEIGNLTQYAEKDEMRAAMREEIDPTISFKISAHATWQFANEMKESDIVFVKRGMRQIIGKGIVTSDYFYDPSIGEEYPNLRKVRWTHNCANDPKEYPGNVAVKTLTDITSYTDTIEKLLAQFADGEDDSDISETIYPPYDAENFLDEVYMDEGSYNTLVSLARAKKNIVLQGPPGVGKTFAAKRLAYSMLGSKDQQRVMMVQFHQSYSYEDFIEGFRPLAAGGFAIKRGSFYNFCRRAAADDVENEYFFIIDEINRGNLSKIFGELFVLIENDKRGNELQLLYSDEKFSVPQNVIIIGMMNTADRSLAILDYALRRRFAFFEMRPGFETEGFRNYRAQLGNEKFDKLINCVKALNDEIARDESLGEDFCIGHSYFCAIDEVTDSALSNIVEFELIPLLKEYWFDEPNKISTWAGNLRGAIR